jgi:hypothetical protein
MYHFSSTKKKELRALLSKRNEAIRVHSMAAGSIVKGEGKPMIY